MNIVIKVKPHKYTASTKNEVLNKALSTKTKTIGTYGSYYKRFTDDGKCYAYYTEKHNPKFKQKRKFHYISTGSKYMFH